jgi:hypothetical protein
MTDRGGVWGKAAKHVAGGERLVHSAVLVDDEHELDEWREDSCGWVDRVTDALLRDDREREVDRFLALACVPYPSPGWRDALREERARMRDAVAFLRTLEP